MRKVFWSFISIILIFMACSPIPPHLRDEGTYLDDCKEELICNVTISTVSFNPKAGQELGIYYTLTHRAKVTVQIFDPDHGLIRTLCRGITKGPGEIQEIWNGRDTEERIVPNEAYFFTIEAEGPSGKKMVYDPTTFSGGEEGIISEADFNEEMGILTYSLPEMGRVLIRMGIKEGALLNALVDWEPRSPGKINEYWNGKDKNNLIDLSNHPRSKMIIIYFALPENSVITYGNDEINYREYKLRLAQNRPQKETRPRLNMPSRPISPHYQLSNIWDREPKITVEFPLKEKTATDDGVLILKGKEVVRVSLDKEYEQFFANQQFEISFFLDTEYYAEEETGYTPFNWLWDLSEVSPGNHILTVNINSYKDQIGILSMKVIVEK